MQNIIITLQHCSFYGMSFSTLFNIHSFGEGQYLGLVQEHLGSQTYPMLLEKALNFQIYWCCDVTEMIIGATQNVHICYLPHICGNKHVKICAASIVEHINYK